MIEKIGQGLKYPPLKKNVNKKLPEYLFWERKDSFGTVDVLMFSTKDLSKRGRITLTKSTQQIKGELVGWAYLPNNNFWVQILGQKAGRSDLQIRQNYVVGLVKPTYYSAEETIKYRF